MLLFVGSLEFYVIALAVAAAIVGALMRPANKAKARVSFCRGETLLTEAAEAESTIAVESDGKGHLLLTHRGVILPSSDCEINCSVTISGEEIKIAERLVVPRTAMPAPQSAAVRFRCPEPPQGRYRLVFESEWSSRWASRHIRLPLPALQTIPLRH